MRVTWKHIYNTLSKQVDYKAKYMEIYMYIYIYIYIYGMIIFIITLLLYQGYTVTFTKALTIHHS
jgi:hypothetical protein